MKKVTIITGLRPGSELIPLIMHMVDGKKAMFFPDGMNDFDELIRSAKDVDIIVIENLRMRDRWKFYNLVTKDSLEIRPTYFKEFIKIDRPEIIALTNKVSKLDFQFPKNSGHIHFIDTPEAIFDLFRKQIERQ